VGRVTAALAAVSFAAGVVTFVVGVRVGHGESALASHLGWGALTVVLQVFTLLVALVHARAAAQEIAALRAQLARAESGPGGLLARPHDG